MPFSLIPFHLSAGGNVGLMVVLTLDSREKPVLVTTVHTCGCYLAIVSTSFLPRDALPPNLDFFVGTDKVYGDRQETGNPFYTSLKPWNRNVSDMGNFARFLEFWGWRL